MPGRPNRRGLLAAIATAAAVVIAAAVIATQIIGHRPAEALHLGSTSPATVGIKSLTITPTTVQMAQHHTARLLLTGLSANGSTVPVKVLAQASWASADPDVATVGPDGTVTATGAGSTYITARIGGTTASARLSVSAPTPTSTPTVTINQPPVTITANPTPVTSGLTPVLGYKVFHSCRAGNTCGLSVHTGPSDSYPVTGTGLADGQPVAVLCQTEGELRTNSRGHSSSVWDELASGGYVSDDYIDTPGVRISATLSSFAPNIARCPS